jgi:FkbM family methyltransferase
MAKNNGWIKNLSQINNISTIVDVGVMEGTFNLYNSFPNAKLLLIDPLIESNENVKSKLGPRPYKFYNYGAGSKEANLKINVNGNPRESSILSRTDPANILERREIIVKKLDDICNNEVTGPAILKIDTEGYELEVLSGAPEIVKKCNYIICETSIVQRFEESYEFEDMIKFMDSNGFKVKAVLHALKLCRCLDILFERKIKI